MLTKVMH